MEPVKAPLKINYAIYSKAETVEERFSWSYKIDPDNEKGPMLKIKGPSQGWFVVFEGSREALHFGDEKPNFDVGDEIKITFEKVNNAKP